MKIDFLIQAKDALRKVAIPNEKVQHITAFVSEEKLKYGLYCCILFFLTSSLVILFMILLRRTILLQQADYSKILVSKYETLLSELMSFFYENGKIFQKKELTVQLDREDKNSSFNRQILLDQILLMKKHVSGEEAEILEGLYQNLGFRKRSLNKLKSRYWYNRLEGLDELILMEIEKIESVFHHMTTDKHHLVRSAAIRALILRGSDWQPALIRYSYPLSLWEKYQICDALSRRQSIQLPDFTPLLKSINPTVIDFGLKMIKQFHSLDAVPKVLPFLKSENPMLAQSAQEVMDQFGFTEEDVMNDEVMSMFFQMA